MVLPELGQKPHFSSWS